jgi:hypothetical protein
MILFGFFLLVAIGTLAAAFNWRHGLLFCYLIGVLQDPMRKAVEGRSVYFVLSFVPVYVAMFGNLAATQADVWRLFRDYPAFRRALALLLGVIGLGAGVTLTSYGIGTLPLVVLGLLGYLGALPAMAIGYSWVLGPSQLRRVLCVAGVISALALVGSVYEYWGYKWEVLGNLNRQDWIHTFGFGKQVRMISGFFRSPEIMGWHGATVAMIGLTLFLTARDRLLAAGWLGMGAWGFVCTLLSGRRKMLLMVLVFAVVLVLRLARSRRPGLALPLLVGGVCLLLAVVFFATQLDLEGGYVELGATTLPSTPQRLEGTSYGAVLETMRQIGVMGYGLGTVSQGAQHLHIERPETWQEGGVAKVMGELGLPGLLVFFYGGCVLLLACLTALRVSLRFADWSLLSTCLFAAVVANACCFVAGQQLYGDPFTLFLVGLLLGFLLSSTRLASRRPAAVRSTVHRQPPSPQSEPPGNGTAGGVPRPDGVAAPS